MNTARSTLYLNMIIAETEPVEMVKRSLDSIKNYVDGMYIGVNYKDKPIKESHPLLKLLKKYGANVITFKWEWDFALARQKVMDATPKGPDKFIYWQDVDDVLTNAQELHHIADQMLGTPYAAAFFTYWYMVDLDEKGAVREILIKHMRERVIRNDDTFRWIGMLHETLIAQKSENINTFARPECIVVHLTESNRMDDNIDRNIEILEKQAVKEQNRDPRTLIYLAKAYFDKGKMAKDPGQMKIFFDLAIALFHGYLEGSGKIGTSSYREGSGWPEERAQAYKYVAEIAFLQGQYKIANEALLEAIKEHPYYPDFYVDLSMIAIAEQDYKKAKHWLQLATTVPAPNTTHITTPRDLKLRALECSFQINLNEQKLENALQDIQMLMQILPNEDSLKERYAKVEELLKENRAAQSVVFLGKYLEERGDMDRLVNLVKSIPASLEQEKFVSEMKHRFLPPKNWGDDEIAILCGPGFEQWSPKSAEGKGLGGSEEAVVYLGRELAKLGWKVTVYANPQSEQGEYDGVIYKQWYDINVNDTFNVLILWRNIGVVDVAPKSKFTLVWMHDVPNNPDFTEDRVAKVDKIAVLSEYHKSILRLHKDGRFHKMPEDKLFLTANGVDMKTQVVDDNTSHESAEPGEFDWHKADVVLTPVKRNPHSMIYSSSPDRGLVYLLNNWAKIREQVPDATLDVYYGFQVFDAIHRNNPTKMAWKEKMLQLMRQPGITYHGRVGHHQLHLAMAKTAVWAYPTDFTEISCITAMKAQILGAIPVCTTLAALDETVKNGVKVDVDITDEDGEKEYFNALVELLKDEEKQREIREPMMKWASSYFGWDQVAGTWDRLFRVHLQNPDMKGGVNGK
jgi:glycosyltransferase involved in cell wall biosynthesis